MAGAVDDLRRQVLLRANEGVGAALRLGNERPAPTVAAAAVLAAVLLLWCMGQKGGSHLCWGLLMYACKRRQHWHNSSPILSYL